MKRTKHWTDGYKEGDKILFGTGLANKGVVAGIEVEGGAVRVAGEGDEDLLPIGVKVRGNDQKKKEEPRYTVRKPQGIKLAPKPKPKPKEAEEDAKTKG